MKKIGIVQFVQIQREPLKQIQNPNNTYDDRIYRPQMIQRVESIRLTPQGIIGIDEDGQELIDVHNETHPQTRYRGGNKLSFGFIQNYDRIQSKFSNHITIGDGGENILIDAKINVTDLQTIGRRFFFKHDDMLIEIREVMGAPPCRPFSVFCANHDIHGKELKEALQFLDHGMRGYYGELISEGENLTVQAGDELWMA